MLKCSIFKLVCFQTFGLFSGWFCSRTNHWINPGLEVERWSNNRLHFASVGLNPVYVWCIDRSVAERLCCNSQCRTPGPLLRVYDTCLRYVFHNRVQSTTSSFTTQRTNGMSLNPVLPPPSFLSSLLRAGKPVIFHSLRPVLFTITNVNSIVCN